MSDNDEQSVKLIDTESCMPTAELAHLWRAGALFSHVPALAAQLAGTAHSLLQLLPDASQSELLGARSSNTCCTRCGVALTTASVQIPRVRRKLVRRARNRVTCGKATKRDRQTLSRSNIRLRVLCSGCGHSFNIRSSTSDSFATDHDRTSTVSSSVQIPPTSAKKSKKSKTSKVRTSEQPLSAAEQLKLLLGNDDDNSVGDSTSKLSRKQSAKASLQKAVKVQQNQQSTNENSTSDLTSFLRSLKGGR